MVGALSLFWRIYFAILSTELCAWSYYIKNFQDAQYFYDAYSYLFNILIYGKFKYFNVVNLS